jgi:alkanesulfonate monooxygenase SsuD/methylene tetrahydromethanopterin reductase-like flavin-dependent oxidoreductase (luciferase family)
MSGDPSAPGRELHLGLWMLTSGGHIGSWRHPKTKPETLLTIGHYVEAANLAARGKFDMVFFEDTLAVRERNGGVFGEASINSLDPLVQIAALAGATRDIGLASSFSTTYHAPRLLADKFATIDRLSGGRAGWNMVTSGAAAGRNFGSGAHPEHATRYGLAHETIEFVKSCWAALPPSPQGRPVLIQAGMSSWGLDFASSYGEAIFAGFKDVEQGRAFRANLRRLAMDKGRSPDALKVLPGFMALVGSTTAEVAEKRAFYRELIHPALLRGMLGERFNHDFADLDLDAPFPIDEILDGLEERPNIGGDRARFVKEIRPGETMLAYAERMASKLSGHLTCEGTPEAVADFMQAWLEGGGCDGFIMQTLQMPVELGIFVDQVVPILQRRGLYRRDYRGSTLRSHLGLPAIS